MGDLSFAGFVGRLARFEFTNCFVAMWFARRTMLKRVVVEPLQGSCAVVFADPGCAARPWAMVFNRFAVSSDAVCSEFLA